MKNKLKNGIELTIQAQVLFEFTEQYPVKREIKMAVNQLKKVAEKDLAKEYARVYAIDPEMSINLCQKTAELAETIGKMDISEIVLFRILLSDFMKTDTLQKKKDNHFLIRYCYENNNFTL